MQLIGVKGLKSMIDKEADIISHMSGTMLISPGFSLPFTS
jgi:hypothetical protein